MEWGTAIFSHTNLECIFFGTPCMGSDDLCSRQHTGSRKQGNHNSEDCNNKDTRKRNRSEERRGERSKSRDCNVRRQPTPGLSLRVSEMTPRARNIEDTPRRQRSLGRGRSGSRGRCNRFKALQPDLFWEEADIFGNIRLSPPRTYPRSTRIVNRVKADTNEPSLTNKEEKKLGLSCAKLS